MLNISSNNEMLYHLSEKFRNSKCMEFLTPILDKYNKQLSLVRFSKHSYYTRLFGIKINYFKSEEDGTKITIEEDNNYIGNLTININKYKNNITIIDNLHYFNGEEKDSTRVMRLAISKNCASYIECSTYRNYYFPNKKQINFAKLVFDSSGNLIDYCDNKNNDNTSIEIRKRNNPEVKYHIA